MNLQEFVKSVLTDIDKAIDDARKEMSRDIHLTTTPEKRTVEFDIAVSAEESEGKTGKAGVRVLSFIEAGGNLEQGTKNSTVSRIQFGVNIDRHTKGERAAGAGMAAIIHPGRHNPGR